VTAPVPRGRAVDRAELTFGDVVVVAGCGPIGLGMIADAKARNPSLVIGLDYAPDRLSIALDSGADLVINIAGTDAVAKIKELTGGYGADIYLEASGHPSAVEQGLNMLRKLGTFVEYSVFGSRATIDWTIVGNEKELDVRGAHLGTHCWPAAIRLIESGRLPMEKICTHQLPLADFKTGLDLVGRGTESVKVTLIP
jgi:erythritol/L-threitol dehydrogenase